MENEKLSVICDVLIAAVFMVAIAVPVCVGIVVLDKGWPLWFLLVLSLTKIKTGSDEKTV